MSVEVVYRCNGCFAIASVTGLMKRWDVDRPSAVTVGGIAYDRCIVRTPTIESAAPEGWMPFDPYTGVCYCPTCWAEIESSDAKPPEGSASGTPQPETANPSTDLPEPGYYGDEPLGTCVIHGDYWTDDCMRCGR